LCSGAADEDQKATGGAVFDAGQQLAYLVRDRTPQNVRDWPNLRLPQPKRLADSFVRLTTPTVRVGRVAAAPAKQWHKSIIVDECKRAEAKTPTRVDAGRRSVDKERLNPGHILLRGSPM
jgi:hypothetical protein